MTLNHHPTILSDSLSSISLADAAKEASLKTDNSVVIDPSIMASNFTRVLQLVQ